MLRNLKKPGLKFFVFLVNIVLTAIAVFVIREKDQSRLFNNSSNNKSSDSNTPGKNLPSFKQTIENSQAESPTADRSTGIPKDFNQTDENAVVVPPADNVALPDQNISPPAPSTTQNSPSVIPNRKTKTS